MKNVFALLMLLRPKQWVKNSFVAAPLFFALKVDQLPAWEASIAAVVAFTFIASAIYILNDVRDREEDRLHPVKKHRPIAAGAVKIPTAAFLAILLLAFGFLITSVLPKACFYVIVTYILMNISYSFFIKRIAILDVITIALGFVLRVLMGAYAIEVVVSPWIILSTFLLALFLGFGKRLHEYNIMNAKSRQALSGYNREFLDKLINATCATSLISYAIYAVEVAQRMGKTNFVFTVFFVAFGLFRYLQFLYLNKEGGSPESILYTDRLFIANILAWLITCVWILGA